MFEEFKQKMDLENLPDIFIRNFEQYYQQLSEGATGQIPEDQISPVQSLPDAETLSEREIRAGNENISKVVFLKLNGGLGTSMGLEKAKSLLVIKEGLTFLDIIARQSIDRDVRLLLMNSFSTQRDSLDFLKKYSELSTDFPLDFLQHKAPKVNQADLRPVKWPDDPALEWCPPGHGDLYLSIATSGVLDILLERGIQYAFISNADNLGAVLDPAILGFFISNHLSFMMEVADRTEADKKGGHLARLRNGQLTLREIAQCPETDLHHFQDVKRHRFFNTNNLWIDLTALRKLLDQKQNILQLPMIRNQKTVDPRDSSSPPVFQIETAVGSAISVFPESGAIRVPRTRFAPVKNTADLLAVRSDLYRLTSDHRIVPDPIREKDLPEIRLDSDYFKLIDDFETRFAGGVPSLKECRHLTIKGDFTFGKNVTLQGQVHLKNTRNKRESIPDGAVVTGE